MLRVVIDTNVFVSGLLSRAGSSAQVLDAWRNRRFLLVTSTAIIAEIQAVLNYPHIRQKYSLSDEDIHELVVILNQDALLVPGKINVAGTIPADPQDEKFLACAIEGQVDLIVSGDHHLLDLVVFEDIPIVTIRQFLDMFPPG
jgi:putative PIN family toxin of toxin-antitoxin system